MPLSVKVVSHTILCKKNKKQAAFESKHSGVNFTLLGLS